MTQVARNTFGVKNECIISLVSQIRCFLFWNSAKVRWSIVLSSDIRSAMSSSEMERARVDVLSATITL